MDSFPITSLPYHLQQEVIKKLKYRAALRLQKTCHWGLEAVDGCKQFAVLREVGENRRKAGSRWTGYDQLEIRVLLKVRSESRMKRDRELQSLVEKILKTWEKIFEKSRYSMGYPTIQRSVFRPKFT